MNQSSRSYLWAEVGAIAGTIVAGVPASLFLVLAVLDVLFQDVSDVYLASLLAACLGATFAGAALGCWLALRVRHLPRAGRTAVLLALLLYGLYAIGWGAVLVFDLPESLEEHGLLWTLAVTYPLTPLVARRLALGWLSPQPRQG